MFLSNKLTIIEINKSIYRTCLQFNFFPKHFKENVIMYALSAYVNRSYENSEVPFSREFVFTGTFSL